MDINIKEIQANLEADEKRTAEMMYDVRTKLEALYKDAFKSETLADMYDTKEYKKLHTSLNRLSNEMELIQSRLHALRTL